MWCRHTTFRLRGSSNRRRHRTSILPTGENEKNRVYPWKWQNFETRIGWATTSDRFQCCSKLPPTSPPPPSQFPSMVSISRCRNRLQEAKLPLHARCTEISNQKHEYFSYCALVQPLAAYEIRLLSQFFSNFYFNWARSVDLGEYGRCLGTAPSHRLRSRHFSLLRGKTS